MNEMSDDLLDDHDNSFEPYEDSDHESDGYAEDSSKDEMEPAEPMVLSNHRAIKLDWAGRSRLDAVLAVLDSIAVQGLDLPLFLDALFYSDSDCHSNQRCRYARDSLMTCDELPRIVEVWHKPPRCPGGQKSCRPFGASHVMEDFALNAVSSKVNRELRISAPLFASDPLDFSEDQLLGVDFEELKTQVLSRNPMLWRILRSAAYSEKQELHNKRKDPDMVVLNIFSQLQYTRSSCRGRIAKLWVIYLKSCGLSARAFDAVHSLGLCMSHRWAANAFTVLSEQAMDRLRQLTQDRLFHFNHDNLNVPLRVFSQGLNNQSHFVNTTAWTVWVLPSHVNLPADINHIFQQFSRARAGTLFDLSPIIVSPKPINNQLFDQRVDIVLRFLLNTSSFQEYLKTHKESPALAPPTPVFQLNGGSENIVEGFIGPTMDQEEASYEGQIKVMINILRSLHWHTIDEQTKIALERFIIWLGDQLTVDRLRGLWRQRHEDHNSFDCLDWMLPQFGWFHLVMAFANSLHKQYLGTSATKGPFWHHLDEAIYHISEAHFLASWLSVSGSQNISELTRYSPTELRDLACKLIRERASHCALHKLDKLPKDAQDSVLRQSIMWNIDVLPYLDLRDAIRKGDVGRMENLLPTLLFRFIGGGNSNYAGEVLSLLQGLRQEWPPEIGMYIRKWCWVFTRNGEADSYLPFDLAQEHNVRDIKVTYCSFGPGATIDYVGRISPGIPTFERVCRHVEVEFGTNSRGAKHGVPDKEEDVKLLLEHYIENGLHDYKQGRRGGFAKDVTTKGTLDVRSKAKVWFERRGLERSTEEDYTGMKEL
ncbi:hypothetical protein EV361DRAFT_1015463 [Lentinula raphanica]|nr:hypothetical protein EV361DRAFT_1015463 [Lentinula raphanica]